MSTKNITKIDQQYGKIMGIKVIGSSTSQLLARVKEFISDSHKFFIVTPNPELILMAQKNKSLKLALNSADFPIPDGVGLKLAIPGLTIIKGREFFMELIRLSAREGWRVFLLGGLGDEAALAASKLKINNLKLVIQTAQGPKLNKKGEAESEVDKKLEKDAIDRINKFSPDLLFVAFGNPAQEIWIHRNIGRLKVKGAMAVGGTFRYIAGMSKLPPEWMGKAGLEWLWRIVTEPKRIRRVFNAVIVFPLSLLLSKKDGTLSGN